MNEIVAKLREYNRWRRGDEGIAQPDPGEIGKCIDAICDMVDADIIRSKMSEWETFCDTSYFDLWRVRRKTERGFNDGFHLQHGEEAKVLVELLNRLERERDEALTDRVNGDIATMTINHYERILRERDMAEDERIDLAQQLRSEQERHAVCQNERDEAREIAARLAHFLERPAYSVDEAIARMEALNSYKNLKSK